MTTFQVGTRPEVSNQPGFDVGDMLHALAAFWSHDRNVRIQIKTPLGLRSEADEGMVRQCLSTKLANSLPQNPAPRHPMTQDPLGPTDRGWPALDGITPFVLIASESGGQARIAIQIAESSTVILLPKTARSSGTRTRSWDH